MIGGTEVGRIVTASPWGVLFAARDAAEGGPCAVGVLHPRLMAVPGLGEGFVEAAEEARRHPHPALVEVRRAGVDRGLAYVVSEWLDGHDAASLLRRCRVRGRMPLRLALSLLLDAGDALARLHARGALHGRLAPDRLFLTRAGHFKLIGLGLRDRHPWPLPEGIDHYAFLAPEQVLGASSRAATDVYTLALVLVSCVAGVNPLRRASRNRSADAILEGDHRIRGGRLDTVLAELPEALRPVVEAALAVDPGERPALDRLRAALAEAVEALGGRVAPVEWEAQLHELFPVQGGIDPVRAVGMEDQAAGVLGALDRKSVV